MTMFKNGAEGQTSGTTVTTTNSAASGDQFGVVGGSSQYDSTRAAFGNRSFRMLPSSGTASNIVYGSGTTALGGTSYAARFYIYLTALPTATHEIWRANAASASLLSRLSLNTAGIFVLAYNNGANTNAWTASTAIPLNQWVRVEVYTVLGAGGRVQAAFYTANSTTALDSGGVTNVTINAGPLQTVAFGKYGTDATATAFWLDEVAVENSASGFIGPYSEALATPVVTLGATTNPTTIGGTNGTQVVTWGSVPNAGSYDAYRASGSSPSQNDFVLIASGVTSPYTFTGLAAGTYSFGIKARP